MPLAPPRKTQWMVETSLTGRVRGLSLRKVDQALEAWEVNKTPDNFAALRRAFREWKLDAGLNWEQSPRNRAPYRVISAMDRSLRRRVVLSARERAARDLLLQDRERRVRQVFEKATIKPRVPAVLQQVHNIAAEYKAQVIEAVTHQPRVREGQPARSFATGPVSRRPPAAKTRTIQVGDYLVIDEPIPETSPENRASLVERLANRALARQLNEVRSGLEDLFGMAVVTYENLVLPEVTNWDAPSIMRTVRTVLSMLPFVSLVMGGVKAVVDAGMAVKSVYNVYDFGTHRGAFAAGAPAAGFNAVEELLRRERANATAQAAIDGAALATNFALHTTGVGAVAGGPASTLLAQTANAIRIITLFAIQVRETLLIDKVLKSPDTIDFSVFEKAPLMGAYMLVGSNTSDLVVMLDQSFGDDQWQDDMQGIITRHIHPVLDSCESLIQSYPFIIDGVPMHRSHTAPSLLESLRQWITGRRF